MAGFGEVQGTVPRLGVRTLEEAMRSGRRPGELVECVELARPDRQREVEERLVPGEATHRTRIRRSWIWVDYAGILLSRVAERWLLEGEVCDVAAADTVVELGSEGFEEFFLREARAAAPAGSLTGTALERLFRSAIDGHAGPVLRVASASSKVGLRNLWGSVASSIVRATGLACRRGGVTTPFAELQAFLDARAELSRKGTIIRPERAVHRGLVGFHRTTCCLWFRVDPGQQCGDCVLSSRERVLSTLDELAAEGAGDA